MLKLDEIKVGAQVRGIQPDEIVSIVQVSPVGDHALTVYYKDNQGRLAEQILFKSDEARLELAQKGRAWAFDASGAEFKLGLEAWRISQAALFDPMMAIHTSNVEPLPHQISAVYESMLPRQPLRFVLADDPGSGKTIMAGLLIRELLMRADARRVLIVAPGSLSEQWQDEMVEKFDVRFDIFSREKQEQCASGNYFDESNLLICRLDQLSRNEELLEKLKVTQWDLVIVDEAHKLSASYFGNKISKTKRFLLGELLGNITRHFLLMTATPHNGKEEDFQIWLSLLDGDRFYGKFREGVHKVDVSDIMRRMIKEELLRFNGTRLFPERRAYTATYTLSDPEASLYEDVTNYVREEMNRADKLDGKRKGNIGFALTQLQRRLASSPEAIYQSLKRRRERLESRLEEERLKARGQTSFSDYVAETMAEYTVTKKIDLPDNLDDLDEELNAEEYELYAERVVDRATASKTASELEKEILILKKLERQASDVVLSKNDRKWEELSRLLQDTPEMLTSEGKLRKMIIFTEYKDTLKYLADRTGDLLGDRKAVRVIHGGVNRDERRKIQEEFRNNPDVLILVATDAAGEGVNLQNANLMINYDLPWNPNRLEQRFGRIHRIGQTEVCHLWNMVAEETREGDVFQRLFDKMEVEKAALGGKVFDILGEAFDNISLKDLLIEAIRYGEQPEVKERVNQKIDNALETDRLREILRRNALVEQHMTPEDIYAVKEEMEKAEARKLQPYFIRAFFSEAFKHLKGELRPRESGRFEIRNVPAAIRARDRVIGETRTPVLQKYERICFEKQHIQSVKPMADLIHPGHPLMRVVMDMVLEDFRSKLRQGAILVDPNDDGIEPEVLFIIEHKVREASGSGTDAKTASKRLQFVRIDKTGNATNAGWAPHLDFIPIDGDGAKLVQDILNAPWITNDLESLALKQVSQELVPEHYKEIKSRRERQADKILDAVHERLVKEINYWSERYIKLAEEAKAGRQPQMQPENARRTVDELTARLEQRTRELQAMKNVVAGTPIVIGAALVIPQGLLDLRKGKTTFTVDIDARKNVENIAMEAVMKTEKRLGFLPEDVSGEKCGWDITSRHPLEKDGYIRSNRYIEVKGRAKGKTTITVTKNEICGGLNQADKFILAIVLVDGQDYEGPYYIRNPFTSEPDFSVASVNYNLKELLSKAVRPEQTI